MTLQLFGGQDHRCFKNISSLQTLQLTTDNSRILEQLISSEHENKFKNIYKNVNSAQKKNIHKNILTFSAVHQLMKITLRKILHRNIGSKNKIVSHRTLDLFITNQHLSISQGTLLRLDNMSITSPTHNLSAFITL